MEKEKEEWQSNDSGYLNCIGVGDTYVRKQIERILNKSYLKAEAISWWPCANGFGNGLVVDANNPRFVSKDNDKKV